MTTINNLHKQLSKMIKDGHGRKRVHINKPTFNHSLELDGCVILPVERADIETYNIIDDNGGHSENKDGSECLRTSLVLSGEK